MRGGEPAGRLEFLAHLRAVARRACTGVATPKAMKNATKVSETNPTWKWTSEMDERGSRDRPAVARSLCAFLSILAKANLLGGCRVLFAPVLRRTHPVGG